MESLGSTHKKQNDNKDDDIISKLPDSVIGHILSFLPTKYAVRTSVLSKRWIESWTLIPKVNLDDSLFYSPKRKKSVGKQYFINFVYKTLLFTQNYSMQSFSLLISNNYDLTLLNTWISCILKKGVKKLSIISNLELPFSALTSHALFNHCNALEELTLWMCCCAIKVPPSPFGYFIFGSLEVLKLDGIIFTIDESLVIHLSKLKKFETKRCSWLSAHDVTIEAPLLESVFIQDVREPLSCKIKFSASCIKEFTYCGYGSMSQPIVLSNSSATRNASVDIYLSNNGSSHFHETRPCVFLLLKQFSQVKWLKFHILVVIDQPNVVVLPKFSMLSDLDLACVSGKVLLVLLQKTPVINTLVLKDISSIDQELLNSAVVPDCLASSLQVVKFEFVNCDQHELLLAKYFMENGRVLERMSFSIRFSVVFSSKVIEEFKEELYSFKKGVSSAILEFDD
ncbi:hypothetical protein TSUD_55140 [Trifolium subterraneum]|uniref:F-box domain-containing protein n=1 Tax=Trifolium subterraneum TaxID=3900 RepID=A0A2Z6M5L0_TRISU|nr:hypothetical protein TSUD_55140 [Trifolium subterraneum]